MKIQYVAEDGETFDSESECIMYEAGPEILKWRIVQYLNDHNDIYWRDPDPENIVEVLMREYDITPKMRG